MAIHQIQRMKFFQRNSSFSDKLFRLSRHNGNRCYDYLIADKIVIPENNKKYFTEKILYLPNCWLPSSKHREISKRNFKKKTS